MELLHVNHEHLVNKDHAGGVNVCLDLTHGPPCSGVNLMLVCPTWQVEAKLDRLIIFAFVIELEINLKVLLALLDLGRARNITWSLKCISLFL
jgi:hypothetical protein